MSASATSLRSPSTPHLHIANEVCPWCEQPIPHDKFSEISARIAEREGAHFAEMTTALKEQHARDKEALEVKAKAELDRIRSEIQQAADAAAQAKLAALAQEREASEVDLRAKIAQAEENGASSKAQLEQMRQENAAALEKMRQDAAEREAAIRQESQAAAEAAMQERLAAVEQTRVAKEAELQAKVANAEQQLQKLQEAHEGDMNRRLQEQREAFEQDKATAVNAEKAKAFEDNLKLSETEQQLQRKLEKKTAEDLGEGAKIDLFEALKLEFEGDQITRINKGQPGADILHVVIHNGRECGSIIYDSKNRNAWRNDYVSKLVQDQMAAKAEHAILSTHKFPADARQVHVQDGIILATPARVVALVQIVRQHVVQRHTLRMSNTERAEKTAALYDFITSERCTQLFERIDSQAQEMLDLQEKEIRAHKTTWKHQGELYRSVQKVRGELSAEIDRIIGTNADADLP
jgi:hypothetical protein